ncbi:hypothetical protein SCHPADRAFT_450884 [Schizopora paradoxa]|uniref:Uncharacterized protein n=1 Tax=Schizopora paradoxa TaxID=27342 RepID=A0A0H2RQQ9_9AGAM|nr:hypothetical protein SCHPADRAFT_450884 [Schizopora paradoxa]
MVGGEEISQETFSRATTRCSNPSDSLLIRLVLDSQINAHAIDVFLDIVRNPAFSSNEVTFRNSEDILTHVARMKDENTRLVENVSSDFPPQIPYVIVQGAIDALRVEMLALSGEDFLLGGLLENDRTLSDCKQIQMTLLNCSLVHRSWFWDARRAAGSFLGKFAKQLHHFIRNPCFGEWTREMYLKFMDLPLPTSSQLDALFKSTPNVKSLVLDFARIRDVSEFSYSFAHMVSACIATTLHFVEEISFTLHESTPNTVLSGFLAFPNVTPFLRSIRISGVNVTLASDPHHLCLCPMPINLASLQSIHVQLSPLKYISTNTGYRSISYIRDDQTNGKFIPDALNFVTNFPEIIWMELSESKIAVLSSIRHLRVNCSMYRGEAQDPLNPSGGVDSFFEACLSLVSLRLLLCLSSYDFVAAPHSPLQAFGSLSPTVQKLHIKFSMGAPTSTMEVACRLIDEALVVALVLLESREPYLRALAIDVVMPLGKGSKSGGSMNARNLLPLSDAWCTGNSVSFSAVVKVLSSTLDLEFSSW